MQNIRNHAYLDRYRAANIVSDKLNCLLAVIFKLTFSLYTSPQTEISKRLNAIIAQIVPFLAAEHQQQVATAVERAKQITMTELNAVIGVSTMKLTSTTTNRFASLKYFKLKSKQL